LITRKEFEEMSEDFLSNPENLRTIGTPAGVRPSRAAAARAVSPYAGLVMA
jgi:hypothetical protein